MYRTPKYPSNGNPILQDPMAMIAVEGRTFSVYASDAVSVRGVLSSGKNGLLFYDNDCERFLYRPIFTDLISSRPTPIQISVVNEFLSVSSWRELFAFFLKIDKTLLLEQFRNCLQDSSVKRGREIFLERAIAFCQTEHLALTRQDLEGEDPFRVLELAVTDMQNLRNGQYLDAIPDIRRPEPDPLLCLSRERRRAERWLSVAGRENSLPGEVMDALQAREASDDGLKLIVDHYMNLVELWEGQPLMSLNGQSMSRADVEDMLTGSSTIFCPTPLGWTPRLRYAFFAPPGFRSEKMEIKRAVIAAMEKKVSQIIHAPVKLLYIEKDNCIVIESVGGSGSGTPPIVCDFDDAQSFEQSVLNASSSDLRCMATTVATTNQAVAPEALNAQISAAEEYVEHLRAEENAGWNEPSEEEEFVQHEEVKPR